MIRKPRWPLSAWPVKIGSSWHPLSSPGRVPAEVEAAPLWEIKRSKRSLSVERGIRLSCPRHAEFMEHMKEVTEYINFRNANPLPGIMTIVTGIGSPAEMKHIDEKWHTESFAWGNARVRRKDFWTKEIAESWKKTQLGAVTRLISCFNCPQQCGGLVSYEGVPRYMMKCFSKLTYSDGGLCR